ncbi:glycosyltransferase family 2 protein [Primorskyibacter sp. S187A]|uniref:glycosyltransferase family 2 protein n=1 Tax=Primorskyibacter sp. S187A TaxID=3415130 RepID=UPI003C7AFEDF
MPLASLIVPAFNVADTLAETLDALLRQTAQDFEIIIVNDGSTDATLDIAQSYEGRGPIHILSQANRGLAGARNTGIDAARGAFIGFCDADDVWRPEKLQSHLTHLMANPALGVSYSGSALIADDGTSLGLSQRPKLTGITAQDILKRNPIGNGSAGVFRKAALREIAYRPAFETQRDWVFDETFRQSEDIECWLRLALSTDWQFEGVDGLLVGYRINASGLSAALDRQYASWERVIDKLRPLDPAFFATEEPAARAYQLRYLARRAVSSQDNDRARGLMREALRTSRKPLIEEPLKTLSTLLAASLPSRLSLTAITALRALKAQ